MRPAAIGVALVMILLAAVVSGDSEDGRAVVQPVFKQQANEPTRGTTAPTGILARLDLERLNRKMSEIEPVDAFAPRTWQAPPPPPKPEPAVVKPSAPVAPQLPFTYFGQFVDSTGAVLVYLHRSGQVHVVKQGETIDDQYRLDAITETQLEFVYLPMKQRQALSIPRQ